MRSINKMGNCCKKPRSEDSAKTCEVESDLITGMPIPHLSFILRHLLPMSYNCESRERLQNDIISIWKENSANDDLEPLPTGSSIEGLDIPLHGNGIFPSGDVDVELPIFPDVDIMIIDNGFIVADAGTVHTLQSDGRQVLEIYTKGVHPGYLQIRSQLTGELNYKNVRTEKGDGYHYICTRKIKHKIRDHMPTSELKDKVTDQGPAVTHDVVPSNKNMSELDMVFPVYRCQPWPEAARNWVTRERRHGWPDPTFISEIVSEGCHVVAAAHPFSKEPDLEWRISFSKAELKIASKINRYQRQAYLLLKIIYSHVLKNPEGLKTYHLKNLFFWILELIPYEDWTPENLGPCLMKMIDCLHKCLKERCLQSYFIPENNLIDRLPQDVCEILASKVEKVRADPLGYLFDFNKQFQLYHGLHLRNADTIFKRILEDATKPTDLIRTGNLFIEQAVHYGCLFIIAQKYAFKREEWDKERKQNVYFLGKNSSQYENAMYFIEDAVRVSEKYIGQLCDAHALLINCVDRLKTVGAIDEAIDFCEYVLRHYPNPRGKNYVNLKSNMACLYHTRYHTCQVEDQRNDFYKLTRSTFQEVMHMDGVTLANKVDYSLFLDKNKEYEHVLDLLSHTTNLEGGLHDGINGYDGPEMETLDVNVKKIAVVQKRVQVFSQSLALYLLVKAYKHLEKNTDELTETYLKYCLALNIKYGKYLAVGNSYVLLSYAYDMLEVEEKAMVMRGIAMFILGEAQSPFQNPITG